MLYRHNKPLFQEKELNTCPSSSPMSPLTHPRVFG
jgi:hypothetical protein